jgi:dihydropteroate synthase
MDGRALFKWCHLRSSQPLIMGVLNITPNSFSDGGHYSNIDNALFRALEMEKEGADLIDIGAEASHPGAEPVSEQLELDRLIPVIERIHAASEIAISVDTYKPNVMKAAIEAGASMINDIKALQVLGSLQMAAELNFPICLMHMQGNPISMQNNPQYPEGIMTSLHDFFFDRIQKCIEAGIPKRLILLDPGIGFGKTYDHNLQILREITELHRYQCPILLGVSRKRVLGELVKKSVNRRMVAGLSAAVYAVMRGVLMIRTHDIAETKQGLTILEALT